MAKVIQFPGGAGQGAAPAGRKPPKFGFTRVRRRPREGPGQMDLFAPASPDVLVFPGGASPFEQALACDEAGHEQRARDGYLAAIAAGDCASDAYCNLGILEYVAGRTEDAFDCFRQALKEDQRHWESHYNLGNLYFDAGQYGPARVHYEVAGQIAPEFRNVHYNLGLVLALQAEYGPAVEALERFRALAPPDEAEAARELLDTLRTSQAHAEARKSRAD